MEGFWPIFFLLVVLKIPVLGSLWLVWWASREPRPEDAQEDEGGFRFGKRDPSRPRGPRRGGPHGAGANQMPDCPPGGRARVMTPPAPLRAGMAHARGSSRSTRERDKH